MKIIIKKDFDMLQCVLRLKDIKNKFKGMELSNILMKLNQNFD